MLMFINRAIGERKAVVLTGLLLVVFLGLFAMGIITPWRGLFITLGGLILVGTFMAIYARQAVLPEAPPPRLAPPTYRLWVPPTAAPLRRLTCYQDD